MGIDYSIKNPNTKITERLVKEFVKNQVEKSADDTADYITFYKKLKACDWLGEERTGFLFTPSPSEKSLEFQFDSGKTHIPFDSLKDVTARKDGKTIFVSFDREYAYQAKSQEVADAVFAAFSDVLAFCKAFPGGISLERTAIKRLNDAGILYDGECTKNLLRWLYGDGQLDLEKTEVLLDLVRTTDCFSAGQKVVFFADGYELGLRAESEYAMDWGGFLEYFITDHWIMNVFATETHVVFCLATRSDSRYVIINNYPCGAGGAYDAAFLKPDVKVLKRSELHAVRAVRCKKADFAQDGTEKGDGEPFIPCADGDLVKIYCKTEQGKEREGKSSAPFFLGQKRPDYKPDPIVEAGYTPLGLLRFADWQNMLHAAGGHHKEKTHNAL